MDKKFDFEHLFKTIPDEAEVSKVLEECLKTSWEKKNHSKIIFTFNKVKRIFLSNRHYVEVKKIGFKIFKAQSGRYCYTNYKNGRYGHYIANLPLEDLVSISLEKKDEDWDKIALRIKSKFHENLWDDLKEKFDGKYLRDNLYKNVSKTSIVDKFPKSVLDALKDAIENKKDYSYYLNGKKRDLSVEVKLDENGILRAWFSSEYSGCANGDYWILINPTTAMFKETD